MMRIAYFCASVFTALHFLANATGIHRPGVIPFLDWPLTVLWLVIGIYAFWWRPE